MCQIMVSHFTIEANTINTNEVKSISLGGCLNKHYTPKTNQEDEPDFEKIGLMTTHRCKGDNVISIRRR